MSIVGSEVRTFFAPAARATPSKLEQQISLVSQHPLTDALLRALNGVVLILNEQRQIIAFNRAVLADLGLDDPEQVLGLRPGEILGCIHADTEPGGCGTTPACADCGAVIAALACIVQNQVVEHDCLMTRKVDGVEQPHEFRARAIPLRFDEQQIVLLALQDIREEKRWQQLDMLLLHDLLNLLAGLHFSCLRLSEVINGGEATEAFNNLQLVVDRLMGAAKTHRLLCAAEANQLTPMVQPTHIAALLGQLESTFRNHPCLGQRTLRVVVDPETDGQATISTDGEMVLRVLTNMVHNALEATPPDTTVLVWCDHDDAGQQFSFCVWNQGAIDLRVARRIFTRYFTTKGGVGRGLGTYSMKLIGEKVLGGKVRFDSTEADGTTFRLDLPR